MGKAYMMEPLNPQPGDVVWALCGGRVRRLEATGPRGTPPRALWRCDGVAQEWWGWSPQLPVTDARPCEAEAEAKAEAEAEAEAEEDFKDQAAVDALRALCASGRTPTEEMQKDAAKAALGLQRLGGQRWQDILDRLTIPV